MMKKLNLIGTTFLALFGLNLISASANSNVSSYESAYKIVRNSQKKHNKYGYSPFKRIKNGYAIKYFNKNKSLIIYDVTNQKKNYFKIIKQNGKNKKVSYVNNSKIKLSSYQNAFKILKYHFSYENSHLSFKPVNKHYNYYVLKLYRYYNNKKHYIGIYTISSHSKTYPKVSINHKETMSELNKIYQLPANLHGKITK